MKMVRDLSDIDKSGLKWHMCRYGVIIDDKILIAKSKSRWKKLGERDWHSYYGLGNLCTALKEDRLDEYAYNQDFNNKRTKVATVVKNSRTHQPEEPL